MCLAVLSDDWFNFSLCSAVLSDGRSSSEQYCQIAGLVLACVQQYCICLMFISIRSCSRLYSIVSVLVLACVQQYLV